MQILVSLVVTHNHQIMYAKGFTHIYQCMLYRDVLPVLKIYKGYTGRYINRWSKQLQTLHMHSSHDIEGTGQFFV